MVDFAKATRESLIQLDILKYLNGQPLCKAIKVMKANEEGTPDIFCVYRGVPLIIEVKASEADAVAAVDNQKRQAMQMDQWQDTGARVIYAWDLVAVEWILHDIRKKL
jgi:Holliday junction resolvase